MARDHRPGAAQGPRALLLDDGDDALRQGGGALDAGRNPRGGEGEGGVPRGQGPRAREPPRAQQHRPGPARRGRGDAERGA